MKETLFRSIIVKKLQEARCFVQPIESGVTGVGIPDIFVRTTKIDCWVECKVEDVGPSSIKIVWRPGQLNWLKAYESIGGRCFLFIMHMDEFRHEPALVVVNRTKFMLKEYIDVDFVNLTHDCGCLKDLCGPELAFILDQW